MSLSNIAMVTGKYGRPGCGINPLRGQNNVQGACDMGASPGDLTGYQKIAATGIVEKFESMGNCSSRDSKDSYATDCFPKMIEGEVKGLFISAKTRCAPTQTRITSSRPHKNLEFWWWMSFTETAKYADVVLPGRSYAEKEGTFSTPNAARSASAKPWNSRNARRHTDIFTDTS